jgi:peroxiredoxin
MDPNDPTVGGDAVPKINLGDVAPNFVLENVESTTGDTRTAERFDLYDRVDNQYLVLEFYPEGLIPRYHEHLQELERLQQEIQRHGGQVAVVAAERLGDLRSHVEQEGLTFPAAADPDRVAHEAFGVTGPNHDRFPGPATFIIAPDRVVRYSSAGAEAPLTGMEVVKLLDKIQGRPTA